MITGRKDLLTNGSAFVLLGAALLAGDLLGLAAGWGPGGGVGSLALPMAAVAAVWAGATMLLYRCRAYPAPAAAAHPAWPAARERSAPS